MKGLLTSIAILLCFAASAQKQDNNWCMGRAAGVDFNTSPPTPFTSQIDAIETTASISDKNTGALLFYSDGFTVWDGNHNIMQNGDSVGYDAVSPSLPQGCVIVPFTNDENKYYIFCLSGRQPHFGKLAYSVIDMTLNGGSGDVVPGSKRILLATNCTEAMAAISGCDKVWLLTQKRGTGDFYTYAIDDMGVNGTPVISQLGINGHAPIGMSMFRPTTDHKKLVSVGAVFSSSGVDSNEYIALHDFNNLTGMVANPTVIDEGANATYYDCEFSPDSKLLYAVNNNVVYQFDITQPIGAAILASRKKVSEATALIGGLQLRDDGNIYIVRYNKDSLDMISNCNAIVPGCTYTRGAIQIGGRGTEKVPAKIVYPSKAGADETYSTDSSLCAGKTIMLSTDAADGEWQDGSKGQSYTVTQAGTYWVRSMGIGCKTVTDTFHVEEVDVTVALVADTMLCSGDTVLLQSNAQPMGTQYQWSTGDTTESIIVGGEGEYVLTVTYKGCTDTDDVAVSIRPPIAIELGSDMELCRGETILLPLSSTTDAMDKYKWQDGSIGRTFTADKAGVYNVTVINECDTISDTLTITDRNCHFFFPSAFSPNGDGLNDIARMVGDVSVIKDYSLRIYNRWGEAVFQTEDANQGWDGYYKGQKGEVGTYYYMIKYTYDGKEELLKGDLMLVR